MTKSIFILMLSLTGSIVFAQQKEQAEKLVDEGVAYNDKGDYDGAINKFNKALELDKDNFSALTEKAYTLLEQEKYEDAIANCKQAIEKHPEEDRRSVTYVTYGNALDGLKKTDESLAVYDEGIKLFPNSYMLHFNKGVTLASVKKYDEALLCYQKSVTIKPTHPGSHNGMARILRVQKKRIPALLAYCRFLVIEPQSKRAKENLESVQTIMQADIEKTGKKSYTIHVDPSVLGDTTADGKPKENSFIATDLLLSMGLGVDFDKKNKKKTEVEQFIMKFEKICTSLEETQKDNHGFYWNYYVPYFVEMKDKNLIETFAYIAFASSDYPDVDKWLKGHKTEITKFYDWSKNFTWASK